MPNAHNGFTKIDRRTIAGLTVGAGECLTADILRLNAECDQLIIHVVLNRAHRQFSP